MVVKRGQKATPVGNKQIGVDDYGNALFTCHHSNKSVAIGNNRIAGNIVPQA
jgi:hypothetical protein